MEPTLLDQTAFSVAGVVGRAAPGRHDYGALWQRFTAASTPILAAATDARYYGAHFICEDPEMVDYLAGMAVPAGTAIPGTETRAVPAGRYASFACTMPTIGVTYAFIYGSWAPPSGWAIDPTRPDLEVYGGPADDDAVEIRVPLSPVPA